MDFRILGPLEVESVGQLLPLGSRQPRALLTVLLLDANRVVSRDRLFEALWGEEPPQRAANALQVYVSQLRKTLGPDIIVTQQPGYLIRIREDELDLQRFERLVGEARHLEPGRAGPTLREALSLWRGQPLAELPDMPFVEGERRRLEELRLGALESRIEADLALGEHASIVSELETLVREHPLRERLRGQLMLALYGSGRQAEALEVYRSGRRLLDDELGIEPGEALKRLERAILAQDPELGTAAPPRRHEPAPVPPSVPTGTVSFLFTDIEGSTRLVQELGDDYGALLDRHHMLLRAALEEHGGQEIDSQGDAFFFAFRRARDAVRAAVDSHVALARADWPEGVEVRIRVGIHTGEPGLAETGYHGLDVVRAARISGVAHGGQTLVSSATRDLVGGSLRDISFLDLGEVALKDIEQPQRIFQVVAPGLRTEFPLLRTVDAARVLPTEGREEALAAAAQAAVGVEVRRLRLFRRSRVAALIGALLVAGAAAGVAVGLTRGGSERVVVQANSVAVVDPRANKLIADIPVGARPVAVAVGEGGVWVANADDGTVSKIDPKTRKVVGNIGIGADLSDIAVGYGSVWVAGGNDGTVTKIDPKLKAIVDTLRVGRGNALAPQPVFSIAIGSGSVWVTKGNDVLRIDPVTDEVSAQIPIPPATGLAVGAGALWVVTQDERLLRISVDSKRLSGSLDLQQGGFAPAVAGGSVWLIDFVGNGSIWRIDPASVSQEATIDAGTFPSTFAVSGNTIWAVEASGTILRIDPNTDRITARIPTAVRDAYAALAVGEGGVWVVFSRPTS